METVSAITLRRKTTGYRRPHPHPLQKFEALVLVLTKCLINSRIASNLGHYDGHGTSLQCFELNLDELIRWAEFRFGSGKVVFLASNVVDSVIDVTCMKLYEDFGVRTMYPHQGYPHQRHVLFLVFPIFMCSLGP